MQFTFHCERSNAFEHQLHSDRCSKVVISGTVYFETADDAFYFAKSLLPIPGTWRIAIGSDAIEQMVREVCI